MICIACEDHLSEVDIRVFRVFEGFGFIDQRCRQCIITGFGEVVRMSKQALLDTLKFLDTRRFYCKSCLTKVKLRYRDPNNTNYCLRCTNSDGRVARLYSQPVEEWPRMTLLDVDVSPSLPTKEILERHDEVSRTRWEKEPTIKISPDELRDLLARLDVKERSKANSQNKQISKNVWRRK